MQVFVISVMAALAVSCGGTTPTSPTLTPARSIAGTWKDFVPVTFTYATTQCGPLAATSTEPLSNITLTITATGDNTVLATMTFNVGASTAVPGCMFDTGRTDPNVAGGAYLMSGTVSSSSVVFTNGGSPAGSYNFTSSIMTGTFLDTLINSGTGAITAQGSTASNAISLTKQ